MSERVYAKSGRKWSQNASGLAELTRHYQVVLDAPLPVGMERTVSPNWHLPKIGDAHPLDAGLFVTGYDFDEGTDADKTVLDITVKYARDGEATETIEPDPEHPEEPAKEYACDEWGWESGNDTRELTFDANRRAVVNSVGDPFDSVPQVSTPAPVFRKVMRFAYRQTGYSKFDCKVNRNAMTIGDYVCPSHSLLCSISEKRIFDSKKYRYQYTVTMKKRENLYTTRDGSGGEVELDAGWDCPVVDSGMRVIDQESISPTFGKKVIVSVKDPETGTMVKVASPVLLNGQGSVLEGERPVPFVHLFIAYPEAEFPDWFTSEPPIESPSEEPTS